MKIFNYFRQLIEDEDLDKIQTQLKKIDLVELDIDTNLSPAEFWGKLRMYERGGEFTFRELSDHALNV